MKTLYLLAVRLSVVGFDSRRLHRIPSRIQPVGGVIAQWIVVSFFMPFQLQAGDGAPWWAAGYRRLQINAAGLSPSARYY